MSAQLATELSSPVRDRYVTVSAPAYVLRNVTLVDGTGRAPQRGVSVVVEEGRITQIGTNVDIPQDADVLTYSGHTLIPGLFGLHDHMYYTAGRTRRPDVVHRAPPLPRSRRDHGADHGEPPALRRTEPHRAPPLPRSRRDHGADHGEPPALRRTEPQVGEAEIDNGRLPGPRIHITAPYITGGEGNTGMTLLSSPEQARRFVAYWAEEGATWIKAYTNIRRAEMAAVVDEAHKRGMKVTGHICSISFAEAVDMGFDNIEHGLHTASDYNPDKEPDMCPPNNRMVALSVDVRGPEVEATFRKMVDGGVAMTSTLPVYEMSYPNRDVKDPRALEAMTPEIREDFAARMSEVPYVMAERMWDPEVRIDGPVATFWTAYDFYRGLEFSHCGTDAFQLAKTPDGWKVAAVSYTVQMPPDCSTHPAGPPGKE